MAGDTANGWTLYFYDFARRFEPVDDVVPGLGDVEVWAKRNGAREGTPFYLDPWGSGGRVGERLLARPAGEGAGHHDCAPLCLVVEGLAGFFERPGRSMGSGVALGTCCLQGVAFIGSGEPSACKRRYFLRRPRGDSRVLLVGGRAARNRQPPSELVRWPPPEV